MKILFVSMPSIHFIRWIESLHNLDAEFYWFDILGRGRLETSLNIKQFVNWKKRKISPLKGEHFLNKKVPNLYTKIQPFLEVTAQEKLELIIQDIKPDIVHSFEMQSCSYPMISVMNKFPKLKWIYSCWGSDLYYYQNIKSQKKRILKALKRINYMHADNLRDSKIAYELGFSGSFLGVIPGGGGYDIESYKKHRKPIHDRNIILVKGYQHKFGRALTVLKSLSAIKSELTEYKVVIFGAHKKVIDYITDSQLPFEVYERHELKQEELIRIMGKSLVYIGNSTSDGMPNTVLEAIVMGAFPIQSNPGSVTEEVIEDGKNGFLISNPEDSQHIKSIISKVLKNNKLLKTSQDYNYKLALKKYNYTDNQKDIINIYKVLIE